MYVLNEYGSELRCADTAQTRKRRMQSKTPLLLRAGALLEEGLTITYFHTGCSTIIGATLFHGPVRDGKGWDQRAMVIRHNL